MYFSEKLNIHPTQMHTAEAVLKAAGMGHIVIDQGRAVASGYLQPSEGAAAVSQAAEVLRIAGLRRLPELPDWVPALPKMAELLRDQYARWWGAGIGGDPPSPDQVLGVTWDAIERGLAAGGLFAKARLGSLRTWVWQVVSDTRDTGNHHTWITATRQWFNERGMWPNTVDEAQEWGLIAA